MAEWSHFDFNEKIWHIPATNTKTSQPHNISLSPFALTQFRAIRRETGHLKHCFPSRDNLSHIGTNTLTKTIGDRRLQFKNRTKTLAGRAANNTLVLSEGKNGAWTLHDLRRTGATMMQTLGIPLDIIDRCQNHAVKTGNRISKVYLQYDYAEEKKLAWNVWSDKIEQILSTEIIQGGLHAP